MPLREVRPEDDRLLQDIADRVAKSHKVLVVTGAGISTSCGIPDFRSKHGLYDMIPEQTLTPMSSVPSTPSKDRFSFEQDFPSSQASSASTTSRRTPTTPTRKLKGQDLFDASVWQTPHSTQVFYRFIASLRQKLREEVKETSLTHKFIRTLRDGGRLMRCYTQNIDGLERRESLSMDLQNGKGSKKRFSRKIWEAPRPSVPANSEADGGCEVVPLHGDLEVLRCTLCQATSAWDEEATDSFLDGLAPECLQCAAKSKDRQHRGKRSVAVGSLRPNIVLYGEEHPSNQLLAPLVPFDVGSGPEVLVIMGTSLKVHGLQKIVREFAKRIHARKDGKGRVICVNRTKPAESVWEKVIDDYVAMDCDDWVADLRARRQDLWLRQGDLNLKVTKAKTSRKRKSMDDDPCTPSKKAKVVVQIPPASKQRRTCTPWRADSIVNETSSDADPCALPTPPPSHGRRSSAKTKYENLDVDRAPTPQSLTPLHDRHQATTDTRNLMQPSTLKDLLQRFTAPPQPVLPTPSTNTWKPSTAAADRPSAISQSPDRPQSFSPIIGPGMRRLKRVRVYRDQEVATDEAGGEDGAEVAERERGREHDHDHDHDPETPTKKCKVLRPISGPGLNVAGVRKTSRGGPVDGRRREGKKEGLVS